MAIGAQIAAVVDDGDVDGLAKVARLRLAADEHAARVFEVNGGLLQHDVNSLCSCPHPCGDSESMQRIVNTTSRRDVPRVKVGIPGIMG